MERILILMQAANWAEATEALTSARRTPCTATRCHTRWCCRKPRHPPKNAIWRRSGRCDTLSARK